MYIFPLADILVGVELDTLAVPPEMDKEKSLASNDPIPPRPLYTASLIVTAMVVLLESRATDDMVGAN